MAITHFSEATGLPLPVREGEVGSPSPTSAPAEMHNSPCPEVMASPLRRARQGVLCHRVRLETGLRPDLGQVRPVEAYARRPRARPARCLPHVGAAGRTRTPALLSGYVLTKHENNSEPRIYISTLGALQKPSHRILKPEGHPIPATRRPLCGHLPLQIILTKGNTAPGDCWPEQGGQIHTSEVGTCPRGEALETQMAARPAA